VVLDDGVVMADGTTYDLLTDEALMRRHRLELPFGFDPTSARSRSPKSIGSLPA
jgi:cobalt/nickel transport system ATP-binding protein